MRNKPTITKKKGCSNRIVGVIFAIILLALIKVLMIHLQLQIKLILKRSMLHQLKPSPLLYPHKHHLLHKNLFMKRLKKYMGTI